MDRFCLAFFLLSRMGDYTIINTEKQGSAHYWIRREKTWYDIDRTIQKAEYCGEAAGLLLFYFFVFFLIQYSRSHSMLDIGSELSCSHAKKRIYYNMKKLFYNLFLFPLFKICHFWNPTESEPFSYYRIVSEVAHVTKIAQFFR